MPSTKSEQIKLYLVIALAVAAAVIAYFRFIHEPRDMAVKATASPSGEIKVNPDRVIKTEVERSKTSRSPYHEYPGMDIKDIFEPAKLRIEPKPPVPVEKKPAPAGDAKQVPASADIARQSPAPVVNLELKGTITGGKNPMAIINDKFVRAGEKIGDYEVVRITPDTVYLRAGSHQKVIRVLTPAGK